MNHKRVYGEYSISMDKYYNLFVLFVADEIDIVLTIAIADFILFL
ncbi:MAG: hypothetical protein PF693_01395 [Spirochaetia bacterium]|nr:hypothetical protein [Spirochaetia bacterium]